MSYLNFAVVHVWKKKWKKHVLVTFILTTFVIFTFKNTVLPTTEVIDLPPSFCKMF